MNFAFIMYSLRIEVCPEAAWSLVWKKVKTDIFAAKIYVFKARYKKKGFSQLILQRVYGRICKKKCVFLAWCNSPGLSVECRILLTLNGHHLGHVTELTETDQMTMMVVITVLLKNTWMSYENNCHKCKAAVFDLRQNCPIRFWALLFMCV